MVHSPSSMLGALALQEQAARYLTSRETIISLGDRCDGPALEKSAHRGQKLPRPQFWGRGRTAARGRAGGRALTPPHALQEDRGGAAHPPRGFRPTTWELCGPREGDSHSFSRGGFREVETQGLCAGDTRHAGRLPRDRLSVISQVSRVFKRTRGLNYSESSAERTRIKKRKADRSVTCLGLPPLPPSSPAARPTEASPLPPPAGARASPPGLENPLHVRRGTQEAASMVPRGPSGKSNLSIEPGFCMNRYLTREVEEHLIQVLTYTHVCPAER